MDVSANVKAWALSAASALAALGLSAQANAHDETVFPEALVEVGAGVIILPSAELCASPASSCAEGDASLEVHAWHFYRPESWYGIGGGLMLAFAPRTDLPHPSYLDNRDQSRGYLTGEASFRYYPYVAEEMQIWLGASAGFVVVRDAVLLPVSPDSSGIVGAQQETLSTLGIAVGLGAGVTMTMVDQWTIGGGLKFSDWFLPDDRKQGPIGNEASLSGSVVAVNLGLDVAYHIDL
jgi:hypothetical protein